MNPHVRMLLCALAGAVVLASCAGPKGDENVKGEGDKAFATAEEATLKAKSDLLAAIDLNKNLNLGIDAARLREAQPGAPVRRVGLDFAKLLATESVTSLSDLAGDEPSVIMPFTAAGEVVGVAEVGKVDAGWKVIGLGNKAVTDDLNAIRSAVGDSSVVLYEVPNLQLPIYESNERYFLSFEQFTLKEGVPLTAFYPALRAKAQAFEQQFGEEVKQQKLVK